MNTLTPEQLASAEKLLASQGHAMAKSLLNGGPGLGSFTEEAELSYDTVWRPENLPAPFWSDLGSKEQDRLVDAFAEAFKSAFQPVGSDSDGCAVCGTLSSPKNGICQYCLNPYHVIKAEESDSLVRPKAIRPPVQESLDQGTDVPPENSELLFLRSSMERIAQEFGIVTPLQLIAMAENDEETYTDLLIKRIRKDHADRSALLIEARGALKLIATDQTTCVHSFSGKPLSSEVAYKALSKLQSIKEPSDEPKEALSPEELKRRNYEAIYG